MRFVLMTAIAAALALPAASAGAADAEAGGRVFRTQCGACHTVEAGKNRVGPSLFGIVGRVSGQVAGFKYSKANQEAHITWTPEVLDKYLTAPKEMVPGTTMAFVGIKNATQRADLIAYLETVK